MIVESFTVDIPVTITSGWPSRLIIVFGSILSTTTLITSSGVLGSPWLPSLIWFRDISGVWVFVVVELFCVVWLSPSSQTNVWSFVSEGFLGLCKIEFKKENPMWHDTAANKP